MIKIGVEELSTTFAGGSASFTGLLLKYGFCHVIFILEKYSLQGTTQGRYLTGGVPPVRFSM